MARKRTKQVSLSLPPDSACEDVTAYIYRHYSSLLTDEERTVARIRMFHEKASHSSGGVAGHLNEELLKLKSEYPALWRRIEEQGFSKVMDAAAQRVLREHADTIFLNRCSRCNALCRTPKARKCLHCGHDWHDAEA